MHTELLVLAVVLGLVPATIASSKGHSFLAFWVYGTLMFIVALPHAIIMKPNSAMIEALQLRDGAHRRCPFCAEIVKARAVVCRFCGREIPIGKDVDAQELERARIAQEKTALDAAFLQAAESGDTDLVESCLDKGANINIRDDSGATAFFIAAAHNRVDVLSLLLERGADFTIKNKSGMTPKEAAIEHGHERIASLL